MEAGFSMPQKIPEEDIIRIKKAFQAQNPEKIPQELMTLIDVFIQFKIDVAVTGDTGSGKSSLINALLGLDHNDEKAAPTGVVETTMEPQMYEYPNNPGLRLWDLSGMGTPTFVSKKYVETMNFDLYDMFIVVTSERFRENNMLLIDEIQKQKKPFYVVRTKVDNDLLSQSKKHSFCKTDALKLMKDECLKYLDEKNPKPHVFLVSGHDPESYDMQKLKETLENEAPELKRDMFSSFMENFFTASWRKAMAIKHHPLKSKNMKTNSLQKLLAIHKNFVDGTEKVGTTLEALDHFQTDVAILGETGSGVTTLVNAITGQTNGTRGSAHTKIPATSPHYPDIRFWDVSGIEKVMDNSLEEILDHFDFYIIIVSDWQKTYHTELAETVKVLRKHYHFVQTKIDCHLNVQEELCCSETEILDGLRAQCAKDLQRENAAQSQLFLINSLDTNAFDFFSLENVLRSDLDTIRTSAFAYYVAKIVKQKQEPHTCQIL
ncbi:immunity-related GTPase family M protein 3 [Hoplias malabaricus]|uniref:immunity-related GTPase family M protein 3 n=1 Tax=Hoplias malabaricus TaxID=27720 RepID=UPI0034625C78